LEKAVLPDPRCKFEADRTPLYDDLHEFPAEDRVEAR
jgi:hypothetical protein